MGGGLLLVAIALQFLMDGAGEAFPGCCAEAPMKPTEIFRRARDFLIQHRDDYATAYRDFRWPVLDRFNWALDWFDVIADGNERTALHLVEEDGSEVQLSYAQLAERSNRVAMYLRHHGVERGAPRPDDAPQLRHLWEVMLAAMKLGAAVIPASSLLTPEDLAGPDRARAGRPRRHRRGRHREVPRPARGLHPPVVGDQVPGWIAFEQAYDEWPPFIPHGDSLPTSRSCSTSPAARPGSRSW